MRTRRGATRLAALTAIPFLLMWLKPDFLPKAVKSTADKSGQRVIVAGVDRVGPDVLEDAEVELGTAAAGGHLQHGRIVGHDERCRAETVHVDRFHRNVQGAAGVTDLAAGDPAAVRGRGR